MTEWRTWHSTKQNSCRGRETREALFCLLPFFLYIFVDLRLQLNAHTPTRFKTLKWFFFCCRPCYRIIQLFRCCCKRSVVSAQDVNSVPSNRQGYITRQNENDTTVFSYRADETFPPSLEGRREPTLWIWSRLKRVVNFFFTPHTPVATVLQVSSTNTDGYCPAHGPLIPFAKEWLSVG